MAFAIAPTTMLLVGVIGGLGSAATFSAYRVAQTLGPELKPIDLRPAFPWEGLPLPIFLYTKPEVMESLRGK